jgi:hypothetical protein
MKLEPCMKFGDGDIISVLSTDTTAIDGIRGLSDIFVTFAKFDKVALKDAIQKNYTNIKAQIGYVIDGITMDLDEENLNILDRISSQSNAYFSDNCNSKFSKDSWIPSTNSKQKSIYCKAQRGKGDRTSCATMTNILCRGCMDTS